jgi:hypothetical protein
VETYSTFDEFWESIKPNFNSIQSVAKYSAKLGWNAACKHLCRIATDCTEWEAAQEAKEMIQ